MKRSKPDIIPNRKSEQNVIAKLLTATQKSKCRRSLWSTLSEFPKIRAINSDMSAALANSRTTEPIRPTPRVPTLLGT